MLALIGLMVWLGVPWWIWGLLVLDVLFFRE